MRSFTTLAFIALWTGMVVGCRSHGGNVEAAAPATATASSKSIETEVQLMAELERHVSNPRDGSDLTGFDEEYLPEAKAMLVRAARKGWIEAAEYCLTHGVQLVPPTSHDDRDALIAAAASIRDVREEGSPYPQRIAAHVPPKMVSLLLRHGATLKAKALYRAVSATGSVCGNPLTRSDQIERERAALAIVDILLESGADIDGKRGWVDYILFEAIRWEICTPHMVKELLRRGADPKQAWAGAALNVPHRIGDEDESEVRHKLESRLEVLNLLFELGADPSGSAARNPHYPVPCKAAASLEYLWGYLAGPDAQHKDYALIALPYYEQAFETVLQAGADIESKIEALKMIMNWREYVEVRHRSPIVVASRIRIIKQLLAQDVVDALDTETQFYTLRAAARYSPQTLRVVLECGLNPDATSSQVRWGHHSLLQDAYSRRWTWKPDNETRVPPARPIVELLLEFGADIDAHAPGVDAPLYCAFDSGNIEATLFLIEHGANVNVRRNRNKQRSLLHELLQGDYDPGGIPDGVEVLFRALLAAGADLDAQDDQGNTPLHAGINHFGANEVLFRALLVAGANTNAQNKQGDTALHLAIARISNKPKVNQPVVALENLHELVALLIKHGADVDTINDQWQTPLLNAAAKPDLGIVQMLLDAGADVNGRCGDDQATPLHLALARGQLQNAIILLDRGAKITTVAEELGGETPLYGCIIYMISRRPDGKDDDWLAMAKRLIAEGADVNSVRVHRNKPRGSVFRRISPLLCEVIYPGLKPRDYKDGSVREKKAQLRRKVVKLLLDSGADANAVQLMREKDRVTGMMIEKNWPALTLAVKDTDILRMLIDKGADVNATGYLNQSALHMATDASSSEVLKLLVEAGADPGLKARQYKPPGRKGTSHFAPYALQRAVRMLASNRRIGEYSHQDLPDHEPMLEAVDALLEAGKSKGIDLNTPLSGGSRLLHTISSPLTIRDLVERGANIDAKDAKGRTPLWGRYLSYYSPRHTGTQYSEKYMQEHRAGTIVRTLIELGADVNARDNDGATPLHSYARDGNHSAAALNRLRTMKGSRAGEVKQWYEPAPRPLDMLLAAGADIEARDKEGKTPLHYAAAIKTPYHAYQEMEESAPRVFSFLVAGADIEARDNQGRTPLFAAVEHDARATLHLLLKSGADVNAKDNKGLTPLAFAEQLHHGYCHRILREHGEKED